MDRAKEMSAVRSCRREALAALDLHCGGQALDVGCGPGDETFELARAVAPAGLGVGVDVSGVMIVEANRRAEGTGLPVRFQESDAQHLPFADDTFDACRTERMLCHVDDPAAALAEMVRVTRPGGRIAAIDVDMEGLLLDSPHVAFTRAFLSSLAEGVRHGQIGRQLPRLFRRAGLGDIAVGFHLVPMDLDLIADICSSHLAWMAGSGHVDEAEAERWWAQLEEDRADGTLLMAAPTVVVSACKQ